MWSEVNFIFGYKCKKQHLNFKKSQGAKVPHSTKSSVLGLSLAMTSDSTKGISDELSSSSDDIMHPQYSKEAAENSFDLDFPLAS